MATEYRGLSSLFPFPFFVSLLAASPPTAAYGGESMRTGPMTGGALGGVLGGSIASPSLPESVGPGRVGSCNIMRQPGRNFRSPQPVNASFCSSGGRPRKVQLRSFGVVSEGSRRRNDLCQGFRTEERGVVAESRSSSHGGRGKRRLPRGKSRRRVGSRIWIRTGYGRPTDGVVSDPPLIEKT